jgi:hypothetical protein
MMLQQSRRQNRMPSLIAKLNAQVLPVVFLLFFFDGKNKKKY